MIYDRLTRTTGFYYCVVGAFILITGLQLIAWIMFEGSSHVSRKHYPLMTAEKNTVYHTVEEITDSLLNGNILNPFYMPYELEPDEEEVLLAYGPVLSESKQMRIMIVCGQHGREMISPEICYHFIRLIQRQERDPELTTRIENLHKRGVGFWIMPLANAWARDTIERDPSLACTRKNSNGIDLNRNFIPMKETRDRNVINRSDRTLTDYAGTEAMSEAETRATDALIQMSTPHILLNVHSGAKKILLPYDQIAEELPPRYGLMVRLAKLARSKTCPECMVGKSSLMLYEVGGTLMDHAIIHRKVPVVYTLEVYDPGDTDYTVTDEDLTAEQCMRWFNPQAGDEYAEVVHQWIDFIVTMAEKGYDRFKTFEY